MKIPFWKRLVSFVYPLTLEIHDSKISGTIDIMLNNNKLLLNAPSVNYSFGSLHTIFRKALHKVYFDRQKKHKVLILGFGAGSIAEILLNEKKLGCVITGIEADKVVIDLAKKHFPINRHKDVSIVQADAYDFVVHQQHNFLYDLICIDLFVNEDVPDPFINKEFFEKCIKLLEINGHILWNFMVTENSSKQLNKLRSYLPKEACKKYLFSGPNEVLHISNAFITPNYTTSYF